MDPDFTNTVHMRIVNYPEITQLREINSDNTGKFMSISGIVITMSMVNAIPKELSYVCERGHTMPIHMERDYTMRDYKKCEIDPECGSRKFETDYSRSKFIDYQILQIQELQEETPDGKLPQVITVFVTEDMVNFANLGETAVISGTIRPDVSDKIRLGKEIPTYHHRLYCNGMEMKNQEINDEITAQDREIITNLLKNNSEEQMTDYLTDALAHRIYGNRILKEAALYCIIGADRIEKEGDNPIRGDLNLLIVGDPGQGKSELGKIIARMSPKSFYVSGKGSTGVGLTVSTLQDPTTKAYMLKPGACVLADNGIAVIDEFDKIDPKDRSSLHEVMEQQCYDDQTEILTEENGWKLFKDLIKGEKVVSMKDGALIYAEPTLYVDEHYKGEIYSIKSDQVDLKITPNHNMYVGLKRHDGWDDYKLIPMKNIDSNEVRFLKSVSDFAEIVWEKHVSTEIYDGRIYCVEVPDHLLYVRRNGKPVWCGNTVSIAKGGITATLNARCSVIAIANPMLGNYDESKSLKDNIPSVPIPLLTRFDMIFVVKDNPHDNKNDENLANYILEHESMDEENTNPIDSDLMKKYIKIAKKVKPKMSADVVKIIREYYIKIRQDAKDEDMTITARQLHAIKRLTIARAKMLMHEITTVDDANHAINIMMEALKTYAMDQVTGEIDYGVAQGKPKENRNQSSMFFIILKDLASVNPLVKHSELVENMVNSGKWDEPGANKFIQDQANNQGTIFEEKPGYWRQM